MKMAKNMDRKGKTGIASMKTAQNVDGIHLVISEILLHVRKPPSSDGESLPRGEGFRERVTLSELISL